MMSNWYVLLKKTVLRKKGPKFTNAVHYTLEIVYRCYGMEGYKRLSLDDRKNGIVNKVISIILGRYYTGSRHYIELLINGSFNAVVDFSKKFVLRFPNFLSLFWSIY